MCLETFWLEIFRMSLVPLHFRYIFLKQSMRANMRYLYMNTLQYIFFWNTTVNWSGILPDEPKATLTRCCFFGLRDDVEGKVKLEPNLIEKDMK